MLSIIKQLMKDNSGELFYSKKSYSQEGEDLVLNRFFESKKQGFYVEVGCHHPYRFSNTYLFYKKGWSGICIDPLPGIVDRFKRWRPRDIVVEVGIAESAGSMQYFMFNEPALNTFDKEIADKRDGLKSYKIIEKRDVPLLPLRDVLKNHLADSNQRIDFMSVDVEGLDIAVLKSNDWRLYRPQVVVAECLNSDIRSLIEDPLTLYLSTLHYVPYAKTGNSVVFVTEDNLGI